MGTRATIELDYVGEITYLACVVYVLCFGGLILVCRSVLSGIRTKSSKHIDKTKQIDENDDDIKSKQMGGLLSKTKKGTSQSFDVTTPPLEHGGGFQEDSNSQGPRSLKQRNKIKNKDSSTSKSKKNIKQDNLTCANELPGNKRSNNKNEEKQTSSSSSSDYAKVKEERNVMTKSFSSDLVCQETYSKKGQNIEFKSIKAISEGNIHHLSESTKFSTEIFDSLSDYFVKPSEDITCPDKETETISIENPPDLKQRSATYDAVIPNTKQMKSNIINKPKNSTKIPHVIEVNSNEKDCSVSETKTRCDNESQTVSTGKHKEEEVINNDITQQKIIKEKSSTVITTEDKHFTGIINKVDPLLKEITEIKVYALKLSCCIMETLYRNIRYELDQRERAKRNRLRFAKDLANSTVNDSTMADFLLEDDASLPNIDCTQNNNNNNTSEEMKCKDNGCHPRIDLYADVVTHRVLHQLRDLPSLENYAKEILDVARDSALTEISNQKKDTLDEQDSSRHDSHDNLSVPEQNLINRRHSGSSDDEAVTNIRLRQSQKSTLERRPLSTYAERLIDFLDDDDDDELSDLTSDGDESDYTNDDDDNHSVETPHKIVIPNPRISKSEAIVSNEEMGYGSDSECSSTFSQGLSAPVTPLSPPFQPEWKGISPRHSISNSPRRLSTAGSNIRSRLNSSVGIDDSTSVMELKDTLVIDFGCGEIRAGFAGQRSPACVFPSLVGLPRRFSQHIGSDIKPSYFGHSAVASAARLQLDHPLKTDGGTDWNNVFYLFENTLEELDVLACERPLLLSCFSECDSREKEKLTEIVFERLNSPGFYLANQNVLTLMSMGLKNGVCLSSGYSATQCSQIYEGSIVSHNIQTLDAGGEEITNHLGRLIMANGGHVFSSSSEKLILEEIKKSCAYIATDLQTELTEVTRKSEKFIPYTLPDGQVIEIGPERFECSEILFNPNEIGSAQLSIPNLISTCILRADKEDRMELVRNIVVTGGTTQLKGFLPRLSIELDSNSFLKGQHRLLKPSDPSLAAWLGGSMFASLPTFENTCMSIDDYEEGGTKGIHRYCF